jgi:hypothetical protein
MRLERHYFKEYQYKGFELEQACVGNEIGWKEIFKKQGISEEKLTHEGLFKAYEKFYPLDPQIPQKKWGKDLFNLVADKLELDIEDPEELKFINVLGTRLDRKGIDCFFLFKNPKTEKEKPCTIDITSHPKKDEWKADLIINKDDIMLDWKKDFEQYMEKLDEIADKIANGLKDKTELIH